MKPWYWIIVGCWAVVMLFGILAIHDYGFATMLPVEQGKGAWSEVMLKVLILLAPVWAAPLAKQKPRDS